ncbi:uncharacterized protein LOC115255333 [Aedes albopictus]|uniref:Uncharacterized protein n=1 Tax=Aedes albopictus TaxID=7160 RepID=A0ABM2A018_AEDAL
MEVISTRSSRTARIALRLQQLEEEHAIELRKIEAERRALALEREALHAKYMLLQKQASIKAVRRNKVGTNDNKPSNDGDTQDAHGRAADLSKGITVSGIQSEKQSNQPIRPLFTELADRSQLSTGIQQQNIGAFPVAILKEQSEIMQCNEKTVEEKFVLLPCHAGESSTTFRELVDPNWELYHTQANSSTDQRLPIIASQRIIEHSFGNDSRDPNYNNAENCAANEVQLLEREKIKYHARVKRMKWFGIQLDPDTGQRSKKVPESSKNLMSNNEVQFLTDVSKSIAAPLLDSHRNGNETNPERPHDSTCCSRGSMDQLISLSATSIATSFACNSNVVGWCFDLNLSIFPPSGNLKAELLLNISTVLKSVSHQLTQIDTAILHQHKNKLSPSRSLIYHSRLWHRYGRSHSCRYSCWKAYDQPRGASLLRNRERNYVRSEDKRRDEKHVNDTTTTWMGYMTDCENPNVMMFGKNANVVSCISSLKRLDRNAARKGVKDSSSKYVNYCFISWGQNDRHDGSACLRHEIQKDTIQQVIMDFVWVGARNQRLVATVMYLARLRDVCSQSSVFERFINNASSVCAPPAKLELESTMSDALQLPMIRSDDADKINIETEQTLTSVFGVNVDPRGCIGRNRGAIRIQDSEENVDRGSKLYRGVWRREVKCAGIIKCAGNDYQFENGDHDVRGERYRQLNEIYFRERQDVITVPNSRRLQDNDRRNSYHRVVSYRFSRDDDYELISVYSSQIVGSVRQASVTMLQSEAIF